MHYVKKQKKSILVWHQKEISNFEIFLFSSTFTRAGRHGDWLITVQIYASAAQVHRAHLTQLCKSSTSKIKHKHKYRPARVCGVLFTSSKGSKYPVVGKMHASKREVRPNYLAMEYLMFR